MSSEVRNTKDYFSYMLSELSVGHSDENVH